jgi:hypothetical protein
MEDQKKPTLRENILRGIANTLAKYQTYDPPPPTDSSIEVRRKELKGTGFGTTTQNVGSWYDKQMEIDPSRVAKYRDYDLMDKEDPELASALDIYADNATKGESETDTVVHIISKDQKVVDILEETVKRINLNHQLWSITRELVKDGDDFEEIVVYPDKEIARIKSLDSATMIVAQDKWGRLDPNYPYIQKNELNEDVAKFKEWQVLHFKLVKDRNSKYGVDGSVLAPIRKIYKQLAMIEDSLVLARLTRAIQRYAYLIDTEGIEPGEPTLEYLDEVMGRMKKRRTINPQTGAMDLEYNPMSMEEDIFVSTKRDSKANVKVLQGSTNLSQLADVEYFRNKKFAGVKVPKAYLSHEKDVRARAMITEQDVQFARTVRRVQLSLIDGLKKLFNFVLATRGIDPEKIKYEIQLPLLSTIDELRLWQVKQIQMNVASMIHRDLKVSLHWILINLLNYDEDDISEIIDYFEDENSLDNKILQRSVETQQMFAPKDKEDGENDKDKDKEGGEVGPTRKKERPKGGKVPSRRDSQTPQKPGEREKEPKESVTDEEIIMLKDNLSVQLEDLQDLIEWILEVKYLHNIKKGD